MQIKQAVNAIRHQRGLSALELVKRTGMSTSGFYGAISTEHVKLSSIEAIAKALNVSVSELIRKQEEITAEYF